MEVAEETESRDILEVDGRGFTDGLDVRDEGIGRLEGDS